MWDVWNREGELMEDDGKAVLAGRLIHSNCPFSLYREKAKGYANVVRHRPWKHAEKQSTYLTIFLIPRRHQPLHITDPTQHGISMIANGRRKEEHTKTYAMK